ncbi:putative membrane protein [Halobacteriovorax marinus SJ]|uniref:Membrane protein n=1 Tax=Halobacteriovorax marinus (strain ATCC BAA-682 / DSM 15412 / SJ) TaxID=862908 RepID=E1WZE3_HALMS|nr:hypothetical protein [Halobacteriovorax marinus]CBW27831.1 putative membrane protein [Halobacteriovorax marinus SJ]
MKKQTNFLITTVLILLNLPVLAEVPIAKREGVSSEYLSCKLYENKRTLTLRQRGARNIEESEELLVPHSIINDHATSAIEARGRASYRWLAHQETYYVQGHKFYATGYENISNSSPASEVLINLINSICDLPQRDFRIFGDFIFNLKIEDKIFKDRVKIQLLRNGDNIPKVVGSYSVPLSFSSPISELTYREDSFSFKIRVKENGQDYYAQFEGQFTGQDSLRGRAVILPERSFLGSFSGERIKK